jgi:hypothetical protein
MLSIGRNGLQGFEQFCDREAKASLSNFVSENDPSLESERFNLLERPNCDLCEDQMDSIEAIARIRSIHSCSLVR